MIADFQAWVGREEEVSEHVAPRVITAMAATMDLHRAPNTGEAVPSGWQWLFFNPTARRSELGVDGHPTRGGFLPPVPLPRRMWAGSRVRYIADLPIGSDATKRSRILKIENKTGKRGALVFVTVEHTIACEGTARIVEEQDIVYRDAPPPSSHPASTPPRHEGVAQWSRSVTPDSTLLFRYSALTFNGHRIHYDQAYARDEEGYPDLVVQGPLTATLLQQFALEHGGSQRLARFEFRGITPLFVSRTFQLEAAAAQDGLTLWARGPDGELAMSASAAFH